MSLHTKLFGLGLLVLTLGFSGCDSGSSGPAAAPAQDELSQYLQDNPDVANAPPEPIEEGTE